MCRIAQIVFMLLSLAPFAGAQTPSTDDLLQKGLAAYQGKQFEAARDSFQQLLDLRKEDVHVLNNLALTYVQLNQQPLSLALWRKALSIRPDYAPAKQGREFLEKQMNLRPFERDQLSLWLQQTLEDVSLLEITWFLALLLALSGYLWIRYAADRLSAIEQEKPMPAFPGTALISSVFLALALTLTSLKIGQNMTSRATVITQKVGARSLPTEEGVLLFEVRGGNEVLVRQTREHWVQVLNGEGNSGWVKDSEIMITSGN